MKSLFVVALSAGMLLAAGCASTPETSRVAAADCKITPITTTSPTGRVGHMTELQRREAEMELGRTDYRLRQLNRQGLVQNNVEEALQDCANK